MIVITGQLHNNDHYNAKITPALCRWQQAVCSAISAWRAQYRLAVGPIVDVRDSFIHFNLFYVRHRGIFIISQICHSQA